MQSSFIFDTAMQAARLGAGVLMETFNTGLTGRSKSGPDLVSEADLVAEQVIIDLIRGRHPDHAVLAEESFATTPPAAWNEAEHLWIIDPLDGTTNYLHNIPHFAVSVACYQRGVPLCGVVLNPARGDLYWAERGCGAWHCGGQYVDAPLSLEPRRLTATPAASLSEVLVGVGFYYDRGEMMEATLAALGDVFRQQVHGIRRFGTAALDLCQVAAGWYGGYFEYQLSPWDFAAGRLIVEEAGGSVTTCAGTPLTIEKSSVLASNGVLHAALLEVVRKHLPK
jgi:myo-inositol-1(or 4)-monophosphatase